MSLALLPERTDLFAVPTSAALTGWDAAFIMVPAALALTIVVTGVLPGPIGDRLWRLRNMFAVEGILYLWFGDLRLMGILALGVVLTTMIAMRTAHTTPQHPRNGTSPKPLTAIGSRLGELFYGIIAGSLLAAAVKVLLPTFDVPAPMLALLGALAGILLPLSPSFSAIPALALTGLDGGLPAAVLWLLLTVARQFDADTRLIRRVAIHRRPRPTSSIE